MVVVVVVQVPRLQEIPKESRTKPLMIEEAGTKARMIEAEEAPIVHETPKDTKTKPSIDGPL